jgi:VWFA-related protein
VFDGIKKVRKGTLDKKAILLISDGEDSASSTSLNEATSAARKSEVLVYGLAISEPRSIISGRTPIPSPGRSPLPFPLPFPLPGPTTGGRVPAGTNGTNIAVMQDLAEASGGRSWVLNTENNRTQMQRALDQIADELRNQYTIGYYPPHDLKDGKWHRISIRTRDSRYTVRTREDYFGQ